MLERYFKDKEFILILTENNGDPWKVLSRGVSDSRLPSSVPVGSSLTRGYMQFFSGCFTANPLSMDLFIPISTGLQVFVLAPRHPAL